MLLKPACRQTGLLNILNLSLRFNPLKVHFSLTVYSVALKCNASSIILAHNHPSENLTPSEADKRLTAKLKKAGEYLDITILDHIIISKDGYFSFTDEMQM